MVLFRQGSRRPNLSLLHRFQDGRLPMSTDVAFSLLFLGNGSLDFAA